MIRVVVALLCVALEAAAKVASTCTNSSLLLEPVDCAAWIAGYDAMNGPGWTRCSENRNDPCGCAGSRVGVTCFKDRITEVLLTRNGLSGPLPAQWSNMTKMESMLLGGNQLNGPLPTQWSQMTQIRQIQLGQNQLQGPLPASWSDMTQITGISLSRNQLSGPLPAQWSDMTQITQIFLNNNKLNGPLPAEWSSMTQITALTLGKNQLNGTLPASWKNMTKLQGIDISGNDLSGNIPLGFPMPPPAASGFPTCIFQEDGGSNNFHCDDHPSVPGKLLAVQCGVPCNIYAPKCRCSSGFSSTGLAFDGSAWEFGDCSASTCECKNGTPVSNTELSDFLCSLGPTNCASCDSGYYLEDFACRPYAGDCKNGNATDQAGRTQHNQCESCDAGFELVAQTCHKTSSPSGGAVSGALPSCLAGTGLVKEKNGTFACKACPPGRYQKQNETRFCVNETNPTCTDGEMLVNGDSRTEDNVCENCAAGMFSNVGTNRVCRDHTPACNNNTHGTLPQFTIRLATPTSDRACANVTPCSNDSGLEQNLVTTIESFVSGDPSNTWYCVESFVGAITNPALLNATGTITDAATGAFSLLNIGIAATATTVTLVGGYTGFGVGAATLSTTAVANAAAATGVAERLATRFASGRFEKASRENLSKSLQTALEKENILEQPASATVVQRAEITRNVIKESVPGLTNEEISDAIMDTDPDLVKEAARQYQAIDAGKSKTKRSQMKALVDMFGVPETRGDNPKREEIIKILSTTPKTKFWVLPKAENKLRLSPVPFPRMVSRTRRQDGHRYHRVQNKQLKF